MPRAQRPKRNKSSYVHVHDMEMAGVSIRHRCESCDKVIYTSKHDARMALTGQLRSKSIRVYPCPSTYGQFHTTKEQSTKLR